MNKKIQKTLIALLLFSFLNLTFAPSVHADAWGSAMGSTIFQITQEKILQSIKETIISNLKMAAIRIIQTRLSSLLGSIGIPMDGVAGMIISDWKAFIFTSASKYSTQVTNNFFTNLNSGATSAMRQYVIIPAQNAVSVDYSNMLPTSGADPSKLYGSGTKNFWTNFEVMARSENDSALIALRAQSLKQAAAQQEAEAKKAEGVAGQGNKSKEKKITVPGAKDGQVMASNGKMVSVPAGSGYTGQQNITVAGSMLGNLRNEINSMPIRMLTLARSIPEVATAMVNQMIAQVIQQGAEKLATGSSSSSSNMSAQMKSQLQSYVQSGVRKAASPNMFFGN